MRFICSCQQCENRYSSALQRFLVACEFEGTLTLGNETVTSNGGFDLLLFSLAENFSSLDMKISDPL